MRTQVCIIGGGPSGLLVGQLLAVAGVHAVVLEKHNRDHVLQRIRAGVLEAGTVDILQRAGVSERLTALGQRHEGFWLTWRQGALRIDLEGLTGKSVTVYGQTEVTRDLYAARDKQGGITVHEAADVEIHGADGRNPVVSYQRLGQRHEVQCDFVIGCDGAHGVSRATIPVEKLAIHEKTYPFGWLGVLSRTPPVQDELIYTAHEDGFALCSMRNPELSRYYVQCHADEDPAEWTDTRFWDTLRSRLPADIANRLVIGPSIEKSVAALRSVVTEPMQWGRLFLVGDAAHIVPPTGAKGLNLAASDVHYLSNALIAWYTQGDEQQLERYSRTALARIWKAERFSWWMTSILHRFPDQSTFDRRMQDAELSWLTGSRAAQTALAENYVGLPL